MTNQKRRGLVRAVVVAAALVGCGVTASVAAGHSQAASTWGNSITPSASTWGNGVHVEAASTWGNRVQPLASTWGN